MRKKRKSAKLRAHAKRAPQQSTPEKKSRRWRNLLWRIPILLLLLVITILLGRNGILHKLETVVLDAQMHVSETPLASEVVSLILQMMTSRTYSARSDR